MKFKVVFRGVKKEIEVDAEDRWDAVTQAVERLKLDRSVSMSFWFDQASVTKLERKKRLAWWEK